MPKIKDNLMRLINKIFRKSSYPMLSNVSKENYDKYHSTYDTLVKIFEGLDDVEAFLVGGISAAVQTGNNLYRQNSDIDIMCNEADLPKLIQKLQEIGYKIEDRRGVKTKNKTDSDGEFTAACHNIDTVMDNSNLLGVGLFVYKIQNNEVITYSYEFDEKLGKYVGTEKVIPKELFDLIYSNKTIDYKGIKLKTQSKEYTYMTKSRGKREKDKEDALIIEPTLDEGSMEKIARIRLLEAKIRRDKNIYDKDGNVESRIRGLSLEEKVDSYLNSLYIKSSNKTAEQIVEDVHKSEQYEKVIKEHPELDSLIKAWQEKAKKYTYKDRIKLLTDDYNRKLKKFDRKAIDNALDFLQRRHQNQGRDNDDIELTPEAKEIFELLKEYEQEIKKIFVDNNIEITHISSIAPDKLEGGILRKSTDRANNYETERVDGVFASSSPVDGKNPYIARNSSGMIRLGKTTYIYGNDNIEVTQDEEGKRHALLRQPNYIYHINPSKFNPVCNLTIDPKTNEPVFEFSEEWISGSDVDISDPKQVSKVEQVKDVTRLLENYTILCDTQRKRIGIQARQLKTKDETLKFIQERIKDGSVRNINQETGINDRDLSAIEK